MVVVRDTRTTGGLLIPEARTVLFRLGSANDLEETVVAIASGRRFLVMASSTGRIGIFPTDAMSTILPDPHAQTSNKKGTLPVLGTTVSFPVASIQCGTPVKSLQLSSDDSLLLVTYGAGIGLVDLTKPELILVPLVLKNHVRFGSLIDDSKLFEVDEKDGLAIHRFTADPPALHEKEKIGHVSSTGKGEFVANASGSLVGFSRNNETVMLIDFANGGQRVFEGKLSPQSGEVTSIHLVNHGSIPGSPVFGVEACGIVVTQRDVLSIFVAREDELELVFQFRDAINKLQFSCTDMDENFLLAISSDTFSRRDRLELYDLTFLKPKSAGMTPIRRWDISRLTADSEHSRIFFLKHRDLLSFVLTGAAGSASLWEPVVRDQWFAVMANFEALNKNQPYQETEEEFDFNQNADLDEVRRTINRYKRTDSAVFNFVPSELIERSKKAEIRAPDVDMEGGVVRREPFFPFLQPIDSWKKLESPNVDISAGISIPTGVTFFSDAAREELKSRIKR
jgi:hypothetical protein